MANTTLTADIIAKEAVMILENNMVMGNLVYRGYEEDFSKKVNGYKVGEVISVRRPADFTVRTSATAAAQDVTEGKITLTVDKRRGVDFKFTSEDLTLQIDKLSERVIKPAMIQLANKVDVDLMDLYKKVYNHVTIPSGGMDSFADFALAPTLMDKFGFPQDDRYAVLCPTDHWALLGSQTALYMQDVAKGAYRNAKIGTIGGVETYMDQNAPWHLTGARTGTDLVDQALVDGTHTWATYKDATTVTLHIDGFASDVAGILLEGDTFTISDVYEVNPVSKATTGVLKKFVVRSTSVTSASAEADVSIWPPIILSGAHQNAYLSSGTEINDNTVTYQGVASTSYQQNMFFHKNAFALAMVPLVSPPGATDVGRQSYKGVNVRVIPVYDGITDESMWRLDILYGTQCIDPRLAVRASLAADI
jgi:hypothetical protein